MISVSIQADGYSLNQWYDIDVLPNDSLIISDSPFLYNTGWDVFFSACKKIQQELPSKPYIFIDAFWDPVFRTNQELEQGMAELAKIFPASKILMLSSRAQHWYDNVPGIVYFPFFAMLSCPDVQRPRKGRIGCLNRRNATHRVVLMYELLSQNLIDTERDVFSVMFSSINSGASFDFKDSNLGWLESKLESWPKAIETHPDNFANDLLVEHPAWHTGIAIVTETDPGNLCLITEKTAKAIISRSCFSIYMADVAYGVMEDLGFEPRFFDNHAEYKNIQPVLEICRTIDTEALALEYRQQHMDQIEHNYGWFGNNVPIKQRPWYGRFEPKLRQALNNL